MPIKGAQTLGFVKNGTTPTINVLREAVPDKVEME
jgi:hypothetical protein